MIQVHDFPRILSSLDQLKFKSETQSAFKQLTATNPKAIIKYCTSVRHRGNKDQEAVVISGGKEDVCNYMRSLQVKEWPEAEPVLAQDASTALWYTLLVKRPFPEGEAALATSAKGSFLYGTEVLHARFIKGEPAIKTKEGFRIAYNEEFPDAKL